MGGLEVQLHSFLTSILDGGGWLTPRSGRFIAGKETLYLLNRKLGEPQNLSGHLWGKKFRCRIPSYVMHAHRRGDKTPLIHTQTVYSRVLLQKLTGAQQIQGFFFNRRREILVSQRGVEQDSRLVGCYPVLTGKQLPRARRFVTVLTKACF